jgi:ribosomal protein L11 methyltransferase
VSGWRQLAVVLPADDAMLASDLFEAAGALSVTTSAASDEALLVAHAGEIAEGAAALWRRCLVTGLFTADSDLTPLREDLRSRFESAEISEAELPDSAWLGGVQTLSLEFGGGSLRLEPRSSRPATGQAGAVVFLDAGLAFGSGSHPTTQMCLEYLAQAMPEGRRVLDYGCGSGILAVAAARLGARRVVAVDIDPQAWLATRDNAHYNGVPETQLLVLSPEEFAAESEPFDVVLANILANPLIALAPVLSAAVARGGRLVLTGVLEPQADAVVAAYPDIPLTVCARRSADGATWVRLEGQRASA